MRRTSDGVALGAVVLLVLLAAACKSSSSSEDAGGGGGTGGVQGGTGGAQGGTGGSGTGGAQGGTGGSGTGGVQSGTGGGSDAGNGSGGDAGSYACGMAGLTCQTGQVCVLHGRGGALVSSECVTDPCAPNALSCTCSAHLCVAEEACIKAAEGNVTCQVGRCAAPDTPIATPSGDRRIADLRVGDLVYSRHRGRLQAVPILNVHRTRVTDHQVVRIELRGGALLEISAAHPTADGHSFADLGARGRLDGIEILSAKIVPYAHPYTYDILPASDSGTYVAGGALIGSTLKAVEPPACWTATGSAPGCETGPGAACIWSGSRRLHVTSEVRALAGERSVEQASAAIGCE